MTADGARSARPTGLVGKASGDLSVSGCISARRIREGVIESLGWLRGGQAAFLVRNRNRDSCYKGSGSAGFRRGAQAGAP